MSYGMRFVTLYRRQGSIPSPWKRNAKIKMAVCGGLTNSCEKKRREAKVKRKDTSICMQSSKDSQGEMKKPSSAINAKKYRKTTEWERLEISSRKLDTKGTFHAKMDME